MNSGPPPSVPASPPGASERARRVVGKLLEPFDRFLRVQAASAIILMVAAAVAFAWANSPWRDSYDALRDTRVALVFGGESYGGTLRFIVNDVLMTIFFFVVGLEIRREIHHGALSSLKRAALPIVAALGGMIAPALLYLVFNHGAATRSGWAVPMATDIAFAVGVLTLLGKRVPSSIRVLLLALAVIDDLGGIVVIAIFYSTGFHIHGLGIAVAALLSIVLLQRVGVRQAALYVPSAIGVWVGLHEAGIHPTLAGVAVALLTPAEPWFGRDGLIACGDEVIAELRAAPTSHEPEEDVVAAVDRLAYASREAVSPLVYIQSLFAPWVAFVIMPLFAFANAGVSIRGGGAAAPHDAHVVSVGILVGLVVGKPVGIALATWLARLTRLAALPDDVDWRGVLLLGAVAGIGFTMAMFVAELAFAGSPLADRARLAILLASVIASLLSLAIGAILFRRRSSAA